MEIPKYLFYKFTKDEIQLCQVKDTHLMDISLTTIRDDDLSIVTDLYANDAKYRDEFINYVNCLKRIPKYRNNKRLFKMKITALKGQFLDSWIVEWALQKRDKIKIINDAITEVDWKLKRQDYQLWKYQHFKGKHRFMDYAKHYYETTGRIPYGYK